MNVNNGADPDAVRAHVARITANELFASAERLCRFLRFTVESKLSGRWIPAIVGAIVVIAIGAVTIPHLMPAPMTASIPATWIQPNDGTMDAVDVALAENVDEGLANQSGTRVVAWPTIAQHPNLHDTALRDVAAHLHASRLVIIMVRDEASTRRISVFAIDEPEDRKHLALTYYADTSLADLAVQSTYANRIVHDLTVGAAQ